MLKKDRTIERYHRSESVREKWKKNFYQRPAKAAFGGREEKKEGGRGKRKKKVRLKEERHSAELTVY